jgi:hypothetical protein
MFTPNFGPFGWIGAVFAAIVWAIGTIILIAICIALLVLLVRFLWFGTKAARRYLELNGQPARMRPMTPASPATPAAAPARPATAAAPATPAKATTTTTTSTTKPASAPKPKP